MQIALLITHIRAEEKLLINAFRERGIEPDVILDRDLHFDLSRGAEQEAPSGVPWNAYNRVLERCVSTSRGLYALAILNRWNVPTLNTYDTAAICADKLQTALALQAHDVPQPETHITFASDSTLDAIETMGYPAVLKPVTGSWGRLLARINDRDSAEAVIEHRQTLGNYTHHTYYIQNYIDKPGRDIRAFVVGNRTVCAIYRASDHWITNTARGGKASNCPITPQINDICQRAAEAVGGGLLALDLLETPDGALLVNEINHTMEFRNSSAPTGVDIPAEIVDYMLQSADTSATHEQNEVRV
jgi:[lysine-biosynthesis-protein LysW]--L-2-aminoadipate ligase